VKRKEKKRSEEKGTSSRGSNKRNKRKARQEIKAEGDNEPRLISHFRPQRKERKRKEERKRRHYRSKKFHCSLEATEWARYHSTHKDTALHRQPVAQHCENHPHLLSVKKGKKEEKSLF